jgi:aerobic carbon-monoxide dehydrogenase large subunit
MLSGTPAADDRHRNLSCATRRWPQGDDGTLLTGNLTTMIPRAPDLPSFALDRTVNPSPVNPQGFRGVGESPTIGSTPAVVNAVLDALAPPGVRDIDPPWTPEKVRRAIERARTGAGK